MTNWTPQTRQNKISITSYKYDDTAITGFIGTHQPAIWMGDYGYITLMPQVGELRTTPEARQLAFSHSDESAKPDYYAVSLRTADGSRIRAELTATERCAYFRFRFPSAGVARVLSKCRGRESPGFAAVDREPARSRAITLTAWMPTWGRIGCRTSKATSSVQFRQAPAERRNVRP